MERRRDKDRRTKREERVGSRWNKFYYMHVLPINAPTSLVSYIKTYVIEPKVMYILLSYRRTVTAFITRMVRENRIQSRPTIMKALQYMEWSQWHHCFVSYFLASPNGPDHWLSAG